MTGSCRRGCLQQRVDTNWLGANHAARFVNYGFHSHSSPVRTDDLICFGDLEGAVRGADLRELNKRRPFFGRGLYEALASSCNVFSCLISKVREPAGVVTVTSSPSFLPIKLRPIGETVEIRPPGGSLSSGVTRR